MTQRIIPIRASAFGGFFDCGYRFQYEQLEGRSRPSSLRAHLGTSIHAGTAAFDQAVLDGAPISANDAAGAMMDVWYSPSGEVDLRDDKLSLKEAERIALTLLTKYCTQIAPTMRYASVEMPLQPLDVECGDDLVIRLTGTMDRARVVVWTALPIAGTNTELMIPPAPQDRRIIADVKTGGRLISDGEVSVKGRAAQLGTYQLLSEHTDGQQTSGSQIVALQTTTKCDVGVSRVFDAKTIMLGQPGREGFLDLAARAFKSGLFLPNPQSALCSNKYCSRHAVCEFKDA